MQGLITLEDDITVDDALMAFETETKKATVLGIHTLYMYCNVISLQYL